MWFLTALASGDFPTAYLAEHYELEYAFLPNSCRRGKRLWSEIVRIEAL